MATAVQEKESAEAAKVNGTAEGATAKNKRARSCSSSSSSSDSEPEKRKSRKDKNENKIENVENGDKNRDKSEGELSECNKSQKSGRSRRKHSTSSTSSDSSSSSERKGKKKKKKKHRSSSKKKHKKRSRSSSDERYYTKLPYKREGHPGNWYSTRGNYPQNRYLTYDKFYWRPYYSNQGRYNNYKEAQKHYDNTAMTYNARRRRSRSRSRGRRSKSRSRSPRRRKSRRSRSRSHSRHSRSNSNSRESHPARRRSRSRSPSRRSEKSEESKRRRSGSREKSHCSARSKSSHRNQSPKPAETKLDAKPSEADPDEVVQNGASPEKDEEKSEKLDKKIVEAEKRNKSGQGYMLSGLSTEQVRRIRDKKMQIEKAYKQDTETFTCVVQMLISKDPALETAIMTSLRENLREMGALCVHELEEYIQQIRLEQIGNP